MSLDASQRNRLRARVETCRERLTDELKALMVSVYGIHSDGQFESHDRLPALADPEARRTRELLDQLLPAAPKSAAGKKAFAAAFDAVVRELAFTHLNRLVAFKMMEQPERGLLRETVGRYLDSSGFKKTAASDDALLALYEGGQAGREEAYRRFLLLRCSELNAEIGALFDPDDVASRVMPRADVLEQVLAEINAPDLEDVWSHDEALGWVYQYWTPKQLRDDTRKAAKSGPRTADEMAFLNQFYTPDYVVRFLADNTLGRLWVEMHPESDLRDVCASLLLRPDEILPSRAKKDPRELKVLDPACGSGHFLLYAFELFERIYCEAWRDPDLGPAIHAAFDANIERYTEAIPRLIVEHNLFGIDIDRRATQIATLALYMKARSRSKSVSLTRSGIVCAEPLPGGRAQLAAFAASAGAGPVHVRILEGLAEAMELAGEAGFLIRMERKLEELVARERDRLLDAKRAFGEQQALLPELKRQLTGEQFDFGDLAHTSFFDVDEAWPRVEAELRALFARYAEAADGAEGTKRRLFRKDGAEALRFVDLARQTYDVILMNPPFGKPSVDTKKSIEAAYPASKSDVLACFVERAIDLSDGGFVGCLSGEAGFYRRTLEPWRRQVLLARAEVVTLAHLGDNVLDGAKIRVAAYTMRSEPCATPRPTAFVRVLGQQGRESRLVSAIRTEREGGRSPDVYRVAQTAFEPLPYAVFGYWCTDVIRAAFQQPAMEPESALVRRGMYSGDDARFLRLRWELAGGIGANWIPFAKGGEYSPYHDDVHLAVPWDSARNTVLGYIGRRGRESPIPESVDYFGRPGLTYPRRTNKRFAPRTLPAGCAFADKGPSVFSPQDSPAALLALLGVLNSRPFGYLLSLGTGMSEADDISNSYEVGLVKRMPMPPAALADVNLARLGAESAALARAPDALDETTARFVLPFPLPASTLDEMARAIVDDRDDACARYAALQLAIEERVCAHYGFGPAERDEIATHVGPPHALGAYSLDDTRRELARRVLSWAVGVVFGRWDVRLATGARPLPQPADPFVELPSLAPAALSAGEVPSDYPVAIDTDGILVLDEGHPDDIVARVQDVLHAVWAEEAPALVAELTTALRVRSLRAYFARAARGGFFGDHFAAYTKSKRQAPIFWLLQSERAGYAVWLYYPRLDRDTLPKILHERYLLGRIQRCRQAIAKLRPEPEAGEAPKTLRRDEQREVEREDGLLVELERFEQAIRAVTGRANERGEIAGYDPDLDDGVAICAAPLDGLMPWPGGKLSEVSRKLAGGKLDWARLAMKYWPDRVRARCETDRSLAIAHGLEAEFFPTPPADGGAP